MTDSTEHGSSPAAPTRCQACDRPLESPLYCAGCHRLYPADGLDYFALLGVSPQYDIDAQAVRRRYFQVSRDIHPDRVAAGGERQDMSMRISAKVNEAYRVLLDPLLRAEYLLSLCGDETLDEKAVPPEVLTETLMLREQIEQARAAGDADRLAEIRRQVEQRHHALGEQVAEAARGLPGDAALRRKLRGALNAIRYTRRMLDELRGP